MLRMPSGLVQLQIQSTSAQINSDSSQIIQASTTPQRITTSQRKRKQREVSPSLASSPAKKRTLFPREAYSPIISMKNDANIERGLLAYDNIRKKAAAPAEKRADALEKINRKLLRQLKKVKDDNIKLKSSAARLVKEIHHVRTEEQSKLYRDGLDGDLDEYVKPSTWTTNKKKSSRLISDLESILKNHSSNERKAVDMMKNILKELKVKQIPENIIQPVVRSVFEPWKIGKYKV